MEGLRGVCFAGGLVRPTTRFFRIGVFFSVSVCFEGSRGVVGLATEVIGATGLGAICVSTHAFVISSGMEIIKLGFVLGVAFGSIFFSIWSAFSVSCETAGSTPSWPVPSCCPGLKLVVVGCGWPCSMGAPPDGFDAMALVSF